MLGSSDKSKSWSGGKLEWGVGYFFVGVAFIVCSSAAYGLPGTILASMAFATLILSALSAKLWPRIPLYVVVCLCLWFLLVHQFHEEFHCPKCGFGTAQNRIEFFKIPFVIREDHFETVRTFIAKDLGCPCAHSEVLPVEAATVDYWGLYFLEDYHQGIAGVGGADAEWYATHVRPAILKYSREHPEFAREFRTRALNEDHDWWSKMYRDELHIIDLIGKQGG